MHHSSCKRFRILLAGKVQAVHRLGIAPLMERCRGLIVLEALQDRTVDYNLVVLQLPADHSKRVVLLVVIDLHLAQAGRGARRYPLLLHVVVDHHRGTGADYALFTGTQ